MQQLTAPDVLHTAKIGAVTFSAQLAVDGVTITVWNGPSRHNATSWSYTDPKLARARWQTIAHLAATGATASQVADTIGADQTHALNAVRALLDDALERATSDSAVAGSLPRALQDLVDETASDTERAELDALAARHPANAAHGQCAADNTDADRPTSLAEMRTAFRTTHPQVPTLAEARQRRARRASLAYTASQARTGR